jgi:hypothetical protein
MRQVLSLLIICQIVAVAVATLIAVANIRTIQYSGPLLSAAGLTIAFISFRRNLPAGLCLGLAAPTAAVFCFSLICGSHWQPDQAAGPMVLILADVNLFHWAAAYCAIRELTAENCDERPRIPFQFSIRALLILMLLVSVSFGSYDMFGKIGVAIAAQLAYIVVIAYFLRLFFVARARKQEDADDSLPASPPTMDR